METVRNVLLHGAVDYLMKPFKFERLKQSLENYSAYRRKLKDKSRLTQKELDSIRFQKEEPEEKKDLPKGLHEVTLHKILTYLTDQSDPVSAENVASSVGIARVTARRYLEHLERKGKLEIDIQYGGVGRPVNKYLISGRA
jgi:two-component system response regulator DctR